MMKYNVGFDENDNVTLSYFREHLLKRINSYRWIEPVHEYLELRGNIINSDICITHKKERPAIQGRNLAIYESAIMEGRTLTPRGLYYYARELFYNEKYDDAIEYFNKFLDTRRGWVEDNIAACYTLSLCYENINDKRNMLKILLKSFEYDISRAEICCILGDYHFNNEGYRKATFWYKLALELEEPVNSWGFIQHDY